MLAHVLTAKEHMMKRKTLPLILVLLFLSSHAPLAFSQQTPSLSEWASVQQIKTNERVYVRQKNGKEIKGRMIEASDTALTIDRDGVLRQVSGFSARRRQIWRKFLPKRVGTMLARVLRKKERTQ